MIETIETIKFHTICQLKLHTKMRNTFWMCNHSIKRMVRTSKSKLAMKSSGRRLAKSNGIESHASPLIHALIAHSPACI